MKAVFTPPQLARVWQVKPETLIRWIRAGELRAFDVARPGARRPRFRITEEAAQEFQQRRAIAKPVARQRRALERPRKEHFPD